MVTVIFQDELIFSVLNWFFQFWVFDFCSFWFDFWSFSSTVKSLYYDHGLDDNLVIQRTSMVCNWLLIIVSYWIAYPRIPIRNCIDLKVKIAVFSKFESVITIPFSINSETDNYRLIRLEITLLKVKLQFFRLELMIAVPPFTIRCILQIRQLQFPNWNFHFRISQTVNFQNCSFQTGNITLVSKTEKFNPIQPATVWTIQESCINPW